MRVLVFLVASCLLVYFTLPFLGDLPIMFALALFQKRIGRKAIIAFLSLIFSGDCFTLLAGMASVDGRLVVAPPFWIFLVAVEVCLTYAFFNFLVRRWRLRERI